jgi:MFS family permease
MPGFFSKDRIVAPPGFNRWAVPPASIGIHLCIGSVYAWSVFNEPLCKVVGVAESAAGDWRLSEVIWIYTVAIVFLGLSAAVAGRWMEQVGPRTVGCVAACCWGSGFLVGALGIALHQLWLVYLGYGVIGGCGAGAGLCFASQHAHQMVSRPARDGDRHGHHGIRRRRHDRRPLEGMADSFVLSGAAVPGRRIGRAAGAA